MGDGRQTITWEVSCMGMFKTDKAFGVDVVSAFPLQPRGVDANGQLRQSSDPFLLWGARVLPDRVETRVDREAGRTDPTTWARKTLLVVASLDQPTKHRLVTTLGSAIADKAEDAEPSDFPCKVELREVDSSFNNPALVIQWLDDVDDATAAQGGGRRNHAEGVELPEPPAPAQAKAKAASK